jgi:hypothetical protein
MGKVLEERFGLYAEGGCYRRRTNDVVYGICQGLDLVTIIKTLELKWLGHVNRMEDHRKPKRVFLGGGRRRGKPRKRWVDDMKDDLRNIGVKRWRIEKKYDAAKVLQGL